MTVPLGVLVAPLVGARLRDFGVVSVSFEVIYRPLPALWTLLFTLAVTLLASLLTVRRVLRIRRPFTIDRDHPAGHAHVEVDHADMVGDHVVQLAGNAPAFLSATCCSLRRDSSVRRRTM
ncbi:hypothetical protein GCM10020219_103540 [Nonomuraea dietziae]